MRAVTYCASETERQYGTHEEAIHMYLVWERWFQMTYVGAELITETDLKRAQATIKDTSGAYREVEVTFNQVVFQPMRASSVPAAMKRFGEALVAEPFIDDRREYADYMAREFLIIHPFEDGNGRVASLLWNYLMGTIVNPEPMPYFFGEGP